MIYTDAVGGPGHCALPLPPLLHPTHPPFTWPSRTPPTSKSAIGNAGLAGKQSLSREEWRPWPNMGWIGPSAPTGRVVRPLYTRCWQACHVFPGSASYLNPYFRVLFVFWQLYFRLYRTAQHDGCISYYSYLKSFFSFKLLINTKCRLSADTFDTLTNSNIRVKRSKDASITWALPPSHYI